ncbi:hypothetical protein [Mesorhizobium sp. M1403]|uniref:hypothetical protein n=1 Tax=Mesorhizobium sp. M1403 TaxID=2957097 RepID=UPI00333C60B8
MIFLATMPRSSGKSWLGIATQDLESAVDGADELEETANVCCKAPEEDSRARPG